MTSELSRFIVVLLGLFLLGGSGVLLWDGFATRTSHHGRDAALHDTEHAMGRLVAGVVGFVIAAWILVGMLARAR
jgi:Na+-transporting methylmalonyl-CoA/oxaloacetate decarboxylase beta subunit